MPVVLVHGNPENAAIWSELLPLLDRKDTVCLSPPGFGAPIPDDFDCSSDSYRDWLAGELDRIGPPIDLVGHDWGGGHVSRIAMERPELIRSWAMDVAGLFEPDYVWHELAQTWQTPEVGEKAVAAMAAAPKDQIAARYQSLGMSATVARKIAAGIDTEMGRAILALYRSAAQPFMARLGERLADAAARPGLVIIATEDHFCGGEPLGRRAAERAGAQVALLEGLGHWWMSQSPERGAEALNRFLGGLE